MQPTTRGTTVAPARGTVACSTTGLVFLVVCALAADVPRAMCDSLAFVGRANGRYQYRAEATDNRWEVGDTIVLTGLENVTAATTPKDFAVEWTFFSVTWTCIQQTPGRPQFDVYSVAGAGNVTYTIISSPPITGTVTGPAYTPEPMTIVLFGGGLMTLAVAARRRRLIGFEPGTEGRYAP